MDSSTHSTDAYCELRMGRRAAPPLARTSTCRKSLAPLWNYDFRIEVDDDDIQDEALEVTVMDHDTIGNDNMIGQVFVSLSPLVKPDGPQQVGLGSAIYAHTCACVIHYLPSYADQRVVSHLRHASRRPGRAAAVHPP